MPVVRLRGVLKERAGDCAEHVADGATVAEVIASLERAQPGLGGWILDERGRVRRHIAVFVNGDQGAGETAVADDDRVDVLPAISGGAR
jgi:molybdopterin synthase sulfur carrier subunit